MTGTTHTPEQLANIPALEIVRFTSPNDHIYGGLDTLRDAERSDDPVIVETATGARERLTPYMPRFSTIAFLTFTVEEVNTIADRLEAVDLDDDASFISVKLEMSDSLRSITGLAGGERALQNRIIKEAESDTAEEKKGITTLTLNKACRIINDTMDERFFNTSEERGDYLIKTEDPNNDGNEEVYGFLARKIAMQIYSERSAKASKANLAAIAVNDTVITEYLEEHADAIQAAGDNDIQLRNLFVDRVRNAKRFGKGGRVHHHETKKESITMVRPSILLNGMQQKMRERIDGQAKNNINTDHEALLNLQYAMMHAVDRLRSEIDSYNGITANPDRIQEIDLSDLLSDA